MTTVNPNADIVARALATGQEAFDQLHAQHITNAVNQGAAIVAAGLATAHNAAQAPIQVNNATVATLLGVQTTVDANATATATATVAPAAPTQQIPDDTQRRSPFMAIVAALFAFIVGFLAMDVIGKHAGGNGGWAHDMASHWLIGIIAAAGIGLWVWSKTRPTTVVRNTFINLPQRQPVTEAND
jgi:hypothetical protein